MLAIGVRAPTFDCTAVVRGQRKPLCWHDIHAGKVLVLFFESVTADLHQLDYLLRLSERAANELSGGEVKAAVVCPDTFYDILTWLERVSDPDAFHLPVILDPEGQIASMYGVVSWEGRVISGRIVVDRRGVVREVALSDAPFPTDVDELIRCVRIL